MPAPLEATMFAIIPSHPEVGDIRAKVWPHISVVPWVDLEGHRHDVFAEVQGIVDSVAPFELRPGGMQTIGGEGFEKSAQRIHSEELKVVHKRILQCLGGFGIVVSHPEWAGNNYSPHITSPRRELLSETTVNTLYAIDNTLLKRGENRGTKVIAQAFESSHEV